MRTKLQSIARLMMVVTVLAAVMILLPGQVSGADSAEMIDVVAQPQPEWVDNPRTRLEVGNPNLVWIKELSMWTESQGYKRFVFYFDRRQMPEGLTELQQADFWDLLRNASIDQYAFEVNGQKDYSAYYRAYVGEPALVSTTVQVEEWDELTAQWVMRDVTTWELENYTIQGRYNSNPGGLDLARIRGN